jgi:hypothetical protein
VKEWSSWFPDLLPHVPGCPQILAEHELRRAAQVLMRRTRAWRIDEAARPVVAGQATVSVAPTSAELELVRVEAVWFDGKPLEPVTDDVMDALYSHDWRSDTGTPSRFLQGVPGEIRLYPVPIADAVTGVTMRLSVAPSEGSTGLPDDLAIRFRDEIHVGAKARLMLSRGVRGRTRTWAPCTARPLTAWWHGHRGRCAIVLRCAYSLSHEVVLTWLYSIQPFSGITNSTKSRARWA